MSFQLFVIFFTWYGSDFLTTLSLQSLEALQDGEHEKQRRHFLYFLLHQVSVSGNFSVLTRQKARQVCVFLHNEIMALLVCSHVSFIFYYLLLLYLSFIFLAYHYCYLL